MARIRSIKPEFWTSEQVMECSPNARLMFIGLWNFCDDEGRMAYSLRQVKALIFPGDEIGSEIIQGMFNELSKNGLIETYVVENKNYFQVTGWQHQKIDKPQDPRCPDKFGEYSRPFAERSRNVRDGREKEKEKEKEKKDTLANANGADAPPPEPEKPQYSDAKHELWGEGRPILAGLGVPEGKAGTIIGRWMKETRDDAMGVLDAIRRARDAKPQEPIAWITRALNPEESKHGKTNSVHAAARKLEAQLAGMGSSGSVVPIGRSGTEGENPPRLLSAR